MPEGLGRFQNYETLDDRICKGCNNKLGELVDEQFCRGGEIGYFRTLLGITGKKSHKTKVDLFQRGAAGASELRMKGTIPGTDDEIRLQLVKTLMADGTVGVDYMPQLIVTTASGEPTPFWIQVYSLPQALTYFASSLAGAAALFILVTNYASLMADISASKAAVFIALFFFAIAGLSGALGRILTQLKGLPGVGGG